MHIIFQIYREGVTTVIFLYFLLCYFDICLCFFFVFFTIISILRNFIFHLHIGLSSYPPTDSSIRLLPLRRSITRHNSKAPLNITATPNTHARNTFRLSNSVNAKANKVQKLPSSDPKVPKPSSTWTSGVDGACFGVL